MLVLQKNGNWAENEEVGSPILGIKDFVRYFCTYIAQNLFLQKNEEANEIQCGQNNYFLFNT